MQYITNDYVLLLLVMTIMYIIEIYLSEGLIDIDIDNIYMLFDLPIFRRALIYITIVKTNIVLFHFHNIYLYFTILNILFDDIDTIVDFHILYSVIYLSFYFEYMPFDILNLKLWYGLMACIYIRNILYKIYKKIF